MVSGAFDDIATDSPITNGPQNCNHRENRRKIRGIQDRKRTEKWRNRATGEISKTI